LHFLLITTGCTYDVEEIFAEKCSSRRKNIFFPDDCKKKEVIKESGNVVASNAVDTDSPSSSLSPSSSASTSASSSASTSGVCDNSKLEMNSNDSSSDETKESDSDKSKSSSTQTSLGKVSFSCDKCDVRMNSAAQLAQVSSTKNKFLFK